MGTISTDIWEKQYIEKGFKSQRLYPNEELLRFMGGNFFDIPHYKRKKIKILEIGCGSGANLWMIAKEGFQAFGIDSSKTGIKLCSKMLRRWQVSADIIIGNILTTLPYEDNYFDAVVDVVTMQHIPFSQHFQVYAEIERVLKKGGRFFSYHQGSKSFLYRNGGGKIIGKFTIDDVRNPKAPLRRVGVYCFPTEKAIEEMLVKTGFRNISIENVIKTYNHRQIKIQYLVIKAQK